MTKVKLPSTVGTAAASEGCARGEASAWGGAGVLSANYTQATTLPSVRSVRATVVGLAQQLHDSSIAPQAALLASTAFAAVRSWGFRVHILRSAMPGLLHP